ncbi:MAG: IPExxxVDY family protein [Crocinitomicaceae bacterium]
MAKHKLVFDETYDFDLIGICCSHPDYRLCWAMNRELKMNLSRGDDYFLRTKKDGEYYFSYYDFINSETHESFYLIKNLSFDNYKRLIPEQDQIDYFLIVKEGYDIDFNDFLADLKKIDCILTAFQFVADDLKSKANLLF